MLGLCLTPSPSTKPEYRPLYSETQPDATSKDGRLELLRKINVQLKTWKDLLHRFLKSNDDQVGMTFICSHQRSQQVALTAPATHVVQQCMHATSLTKPVT